MNVFSLSLHDFTEILKGVSDLVLYLFFVFSTFIENIFPPWPSDTLIIFSGFLASKGVISLTGAFIVSLLGNIGGGLVMYFFGSSVYRETRKIQHKLHVSRGILDKIFNFASHESLVEARKMFEKYGAGFVLISRFFPGIRFFVSIIAGMNAMNPLVYLISFAAGSSVWGLILVFTGYFLGSQWENALQWMKYYNTFAMLVSVILIALVVLVFRRKSLLQKYIYRNKK